MVLEIVKYPNKILKAECELVEFPMTDATKQLCQDMKETCAEHKGLGLAANQVNADLKMFVMRIDHDKPEEPSSYSVFINPIVIAGSSKFWSSEGCLSLPDREFTVRRHRSVTIAYYDENGEIYNDVVLEGIEAIIAQHEYDHLKGISLIDKFQK